MPGNRNARVSDQNASMFLQDPETHKFVRSELRKSGGSQVGDSGLLRSKHVKTLAVMTSMHEEKEYLLAENARLSAKVEELEQKLTFFSPEEHARWSLKHESVQEEQAKNADLQSLVEKLRADNKKALTQAQRAADMQRFPLLSEIKTLKEQLAAQNTLQSNQSGQSVSAQAPAPARSPDRASRSEKQLQELKKMAALMQVSLSRFVRVN
jgi:hypothetical protein